MKIRLLVAAGFFVLFCSLTKHAKQIEKAQWLIGTWENKTAKGTLYESWTKAADKQLSGKSYMLKDKDTIAFETVKLAEEQGRLYYIPTVKNQNGGLPVRFKLKTLSDKQMVFENPEHDFPQVITYTQITEDSLVAEISGMLKGQINRRIFPMRRVH